MSIEVAATRPLVREALLAAGTAATVAALLCWLGPPGSDFAAHVYQRSVFLEHGFALWNNFWYAGRYSFVTYSLLYYPLAAVLGIRLLAVATIAVAALAFAVVVGHEWGRPARWSSRTFAVVWAAIVLSAAFPFVLGVAFAMLALWALQAGRRWRFASLVLLTVAASALAFLLLAVLLAAIGLSRGRERSQIVLPASILAIAAATEIVLWRLFPSSGRFPFSPEELLAACAFCVIGTVVTWRAEQTRLLRWIFPVYLVACLGAYAVPSAVGENVTRLRFAAVPLAVLALSLRHWRPPLVAAGVLALALSWNFTPLLASFEKGRDDPTAHAAYWQPAIDFLRSNLTPSYRVEVVDTVGHWAAVYLPRAGIPLARGWFRQDDFPQNSVLYERVGTGSYAAWLRTLGIRYVVLTRARPDYSARSEAALLASGRSGLRPVFRAPNLTIFALPSPRKLVTGPGRPSVDALTETRLTLRLTQPGRYRVAVRYSPYWHARAACVERGGDGMIRLATRRTGLVVLEFDVDPERALAALAGDGNARCGDA
jgi:hypothetical protein